MDNKLEEDILQMIEHSQNNVDNGGSFSQFVLLVDAIKNLCTAEQNKNVISKDK